MAQVAADMLGLPIDNVSVKLGDSTLPQCAGRRRIVDRGLGVRTRSRRRPTRSASELLQLAQKMPDSPLAGAAPDDVVLADGKIVSKQDAEPRGVDRRARCGTASVDRIEQEETNEFDAGRASMRATRTRRSSPR